MAISSVAFLGGLDYFLKALQLKAAGLMAIRSPQILQLPSKRDPLMLGRSVGKDRRLRFT